MMYNLYISIMRLSKVCLFILFILLVLLMIMSTSKNIKGSGWSNTGNEIHLVNICFMSSIISAMCLDSSLRQECIEKLDTMIPDYPDLAPLKSLMDNNIGGYMDIPPYYEYRAQKNPALYDFSGSLVMFRLPGRATSFISRLMVKDAKLPPTVKPLMGNDISSKEKCKGSSFINLMKIFILDPDDAKDVLYNTLYKIGGGFSLVFTAETAIRPTIRMDDSDQDRPDFPKTRSYGDGAQDRREVPKTKSFGGGEKQSIIIQPYDLSTMLLQLFPQHIGHIHTIFLRIKFTNIKGKDDITHIIVLSHNSEDKLFQIDMNEVNYKRLHKPIADDNQLLAMIQEQIDAFQLEDEISTLKIELELICVILKLDRPIVSILDGDGESRYRLGVIAITKRVIERTKKFLKLVLGYYVQFPENTSQMAYNLAYNVGVPVFQQSGANRETLQEIRRIVAILLSEMLPIRKYIDLFMEGMVADDAQWEEIQKELAARITAEAYEGFGSSDD